MVERRVPKQGTEQCEPNISQRMQPATEVFPGESLSSSRRNGVAALPGRRRDEITVRVADSQHNVSGVGRKRRKAAEPLSDREQEFLKTKLGISDFTNGRPELFRALINGWDNAKADPLAHVELPDGSKREERAKRIVAEQKRRKARLRTLQSIDNQDSTRLSQAISQAKLSDIEREILRRRIEGQTMAEIGKALGRPANRIPEPANDAMKAVLKVLSSESSAQ